MSSKSLVKGPGVKGLGKRKCRVCGEVKGHYYSGKTRVEKIVRGTAKTISNCAHLYVDDEDKRWDARRCNDCFREYVNEYNRQ